VSPLTTRPKTSAAPSRRRLLLFGPLLLFLSACSVVHVHGIAPISKPGFAAGHLPAATSIGAARRPRAMPAPAVDGYARAPSDLAAAQARLAAAAAAERASDAGRWPAAVLAQYLELAQWSYAQLAFPSGRSAANTGELLDLYNYATERFVALAFAHRDRALADGILEEGIAVGGRRVRIGKLDVRLPGGVLRPAELIPASQLRFDGVRNMHRRDGLGADLVAVTNPDEAPPQLAPLNEVPYVSVTAVLRFPGATPREALAAAAEIEVYDPARTATVAVGTTQFPLAANFTAPYALWLARADFERQAGMALVQRQSRLDAPRLYAMQPYDPNRETVVLLHGLGASPASWVNLVNDVMGDPELRSRYQIWQVFYPTNLPPIENRITIRRVLLDAFAAVDPAGDDIATRHVSLVGHSMGGVIARLLVVDAGDALWRRVLGDELESLDRSTLAALDPYLTMIPMPQVDTAIFVAAPHRGSPVADKLGGRLVASLVRLPSAMIERVKSLNTLIARTATRDDVQLLKRPTSIRTLGVRNEYLRITADLPIPPGVTYHTIVGREDENEPLEDSSDGFVPYSSAHLDGAASELVVTGDHHVHDDPTGIAEIVRILRERQKR
jgi:triacylglycerol esterase/lipase EstA (alpha/beta hydrolase family)